MAETKKPGNEAQGAFLVIRVRGHAQTRAPVEETMSQLHLSRLHHAIILPNTIYYKGMLQKIKDFVTWGTADEATVKALLENAPLAQGGKKLADANLAKTEYKTVAGLAKALIEGKTTLSQVKGIKNVARLKSPKKGSGDIKQAYPKGALGNRAGKISEYAKQMM